MFNNRTDIYWDKLEESLERFKYETVAAQKNGHCFIHAIRLCLECEHGMFFTESDIKKLITYEVYQNNHLYIAFYDGHIMSMLRSLDRYIVNGIFTHQVVDIVVLAAANILRVNLCIYKNANGRAILYVQPSNPPSTCDVYLLYDNEHYDAIVPMKSGETSCVILSFNITQEDVAAFAKIGASFHVTDPSQINGGKLYFVPPKDFCMISGDAVVGDDILNSNDRQKQITTEETIPMQQNIYDNDFDGSVFVPNSDVLENGVRDFNNDI